MPLRAGISWICSSTAYTAAGKIIGVNLQPSWPIQREVDELDRSILENIVGHDCRKWRATATAKDHRNLKLRKYKIMAYHSFLLLLIDSLSIIIATVGDDSYQRQLAGQFGHPPPQTHANIGPPTERRGPDLSPVPSLSMKDVYSTIQRPWKDSYSDIAAM